MKIATKPECSECASLFARLGTCNEENRRLMGEVRKYRAPAEEAIALREELDRLGAPTTTEKGHSLTLTGRLRAFVSASIVSLVVCFVPTLIWEVFR